ncbi:MAG TPA: extracellular solute-binding protein [Bacillota bacterium]|nr:extracellular solute-binding protein [Bacillota bacterium]
MKTLTTRIICLILVLGVLVSISSACKNGDTPKSSQDISEQTTDIADETGGTDSTVTTTDTDGTTGSEDKSGVTSTTTSKETTTTTTKPKSATSLTRDQVLAKMPAKLKGTTINYFMFTDPKQTIQKSAVEAFEKATGIKIKVEIANKQQYNTQLSAKVSSGSSPDMVIRITNDIDFVLNLQPITNSGFDFNDTAWDKEVMEAFTFNGRVYATALKNSPIRNLGVILYNMKALQKAEMEEDPYEIWKKNPQNWTWDKLWSMCDTFLKANKNKEGYYGITFTVPDGYLRSFGVSFYKYDAKAGKYVNTINSAEAKKRYEILVDAVQKKYVTRTDDTSSFSMGRILFAFSYSSILEKNHAHFSQIRKYLGSVPVPTDSTYQPLFEYCAYGIPVGAKNAAAVPYFLRYAWDPQSYDMKNFYENEQARDVVEYSTSRGNYYLGFGYRWAVYNEMLNGTPAQVKTILDSYVGEFDGLVASANEQIKNIPTK